MRAAKYANAVYHFTPASRARSLRRIHILAALLFSGSALSSCTAFAQRQSDLTASASTNVAPVSSSAAEPAGSAAYVSRGLPSYPTRRLRIAVDAHVGANGIGSEVTVPITSHFNLRAGSDLLNYSTVRQSNGNNININLHLMSAHATLDWYPTRHAFRISPLLVFANSNHMYNSVNVLPGQEFDLSGGTYISSASDPLRGSAFVGLRRVSPGVTFGVGHYIPKTGHHFSVPFEAGFYYVGQPSFNLQFSGTACDPRLPASMGCESIQNDPYFKSDLATFKAKYQPYVNDLRFFPILSSGLAFAF